MMPGEWTISQHRHTDTDTYTHKHTYTQYLNTSGTEIYLLNVK